MKDLKISKELFKEVLEEEVIETGSFNYPILEINIQRYSYREWQKINICEFAFKCKEWALQKGYKIQTQINSEDKGHSHITKINNDSWAKGFFEDTEIKSIIKSCEFILTKKESK